MKKSYEISEEINNEIIEYCKSLLLFINPGFLKFNNILQNEFLAFLYSTCIALYTKSGDYKLRTKEIIMLLTAKKENDMVLDNSDDATVIGVEKGDKLIMKMHEDNKKIENNEQ